MKHNLQEENTKDDPFKMKKLKSIPNIASVPSISHSFLSKGLEQQGPPKFGSHYNSDVLKGSATKNTPTRGATKFHQQNSFGSSSNSFGNTNSGFNNNPFSSNNGHQWESNFNPSWNGENVGLSSINSYSFTTPEPQLYLKAYRKVPNNKISSKTQKELNTSLRPPPKLVKGFITVKKSS